MTKPEVYALYKGEQILATGTKREIAEARGLQLNTLHYMCTNTYRERIRKSDEGRGQLQRLVPLDIDDDED